MIAEVIPLIRLPKNISSFSYVVPPELAAECIPGQLLYIPFRNKKILGLLKSVTDGSAEKLKSILSVVNPTPFLGLDYVEFLEQLAVMYGVAPSVMINMALPPLQPTKLKKNKLTDWQLVRKQTVKPNYHYYRNQIEHTSAFSHYSQERIVIIVPEVHHVPEVVNNLLEERKAEAVIWDSGLSEKEQGLLWYRIRNGEIRTLVGTRGALFLPLTQSFDRVIIDYEQAANHKHWDQSPRYYTKDIAKLLSRRFDLHYTEMSYSPSAASYFFIHKKNYELIGNGMPLFTASKHNDDYGKPLPIIVDIQGTKGKFPSGIDAAVQEIIIKNEPGDILFLLNRKGYATAMICQNCGERALCPNCELPLVYHAEANAMQCHYCHHTEPTRIACPKCRSPFIRLSGAGTEFIAHELESIIPSKTTWKIMTVDADTTSDVTAERRIIIGTVAALNNIRWNMLQLVVLLDFDRQLSLPELYAQEDVWQLIREIQYYKPNGTPFYIQTRKPDHPLLRALTEPDRWYRVELNHRRALKFPPYSYVSRYLVGADSIDEANQQAKIVVEVIKSALTKTNKKIIIEGPIQAEPSFLRRKYWSVIIAKISESNISESMSWLNELVPADWKIDPNPKSLLNPR